jgi:hypothetical protein
MVFEQLHRRSVSVLKLSKSCLNPKLKFSITTVLLTPVVAPKLNVKLGKEVMEDTVHATR